MERHERSRLLVAGRRQGGARRLRRRSADLGRGRAACWPRSSAGSGSPSAWRAASRTRDRRSGSTTPLAEMIRFRVLLIAAGYPDANDCDALRADPAFKMAVGRLPESGADLCSQPTMCRLENLPSATALKRMMAAMVELFCDSFDAGAAPDRARHRRHRGPGPR